MLGRRVLKMDLSVRSFFYVVKTRIETHLKKSHQSSCKENPLTRAVLARLLERMEGILGIVCGCQFLQRKDSVF